MADIARIPFEQAALSTFDRFLGVLYPNVNRRGPTRLINAIGVYHRKRTRAGLQWCPLCLSEDEEPYFRLHWRLSLMSTCPRHGVILECKCGQCGEPVAPHRSKDHTCHKCRFDRRHASPITADSSVLQFEGAIYSIMYDDHPTFLGGENVHPLVFFGTLSRLQDLLVGNSRSQYLRDVISRHIGIDSVFLEQYSRPQPEYLLSQDRHDINRMLNRLITGWPWMFVGFCQEARMMWSWATKDRTLDRLTYPIVDVANKYLSENVAIRKAMTR